MRNKNDPQWRSAMPEDLDLGSPSNGDDELEAMASAGDDVEYMFA